MRIHLIASLLLALSCAAANYAATAATTKTYSAVPNVFESKRIAGVDVMALYNIENKEYCAIVACRHMDTVPVVNAVSYCLSESGCQGGAVPSRTCVLKHVDDIRNPPGTAEEEDSHATSGDWASLTIDPLDGGCYGTGRR